MSLPLQIDEKQMFFGSQLFGICDIFSLRHTIIHNEYYSFITGKTIVIHIMSWWFRTVFKV